MVKLKLGAIADDKPVKLTMELPANVHRDLVAYSDELAGETGNRSRIQQNWSRRCWRASWQRIEPLRDARVSLRRARDSARSTV
ncbi:hypothetical protein V1290_002216 [Bradyrhizobium sp. AZCC 1578]